MSDEPFFRVTRGTPTPDELAALVGVLWARRQAAAASATEAPRASRWRDSARPAPRFPHPGPGAWRSAN